jgi:Domain of unknown function(DUF2779)
MRGLQCPKQLFLHLNNPELAEEEQNLKAKNQGTEIGILAHRLFKRGILVKEKDPIKALAETQELIKKNNILFEPAFLFEDLYFRADILKTTPKGVTLLEVKSSTEVKPYHIQDASIQALILSKLGHKIDRIYICHVNKNYTTRDPISKFFIKNDVTSEVLDQLPLMEEKIFKIKELIRSNPDIKIGPHCTKPFACLFRSHCNKESRVPKNCIISFPNLSNKWDLFKSGKREVGDLELKDLKSEQQKTLLVRSQLDKISIDSQKILASFKSWDKPLWFLDFETFDSVFPLYKKTRPNTHIPYQFSLAKIKNGKPVIVESYIADDISLDPRKELAKNLINSIGKNGSIVTYNMSFEKTRIQEMADLIPEFRKELLLIKDRIVDLLPLMRSSVYHPGFNFSWSLKSVIPAIFGEQASYSKNKINDGLQSQKTYLDAIRNNTIEENRQDLIDYCNKDVLEMARLYIYLHENAKKNSSRSKRLD